MTNGQNGYWWTSPWAQFEQMAYPAQWQAADWQSQLAKALQAKPSQPEQRKDRKNSMLYEVAVTKLPTPLEAEKGVGEKIVLPFKQIVANSDHVALLLAGAQSAKELLAESNPDYFAVKIRKS